MCPKMLFENVDVVLKDTKHSSKDVDCMVIFIARDYLQLLPVVPETRTVVDSVQTRIVSVNLFCEGTWYSCEVWDRSLKVTQISEQVRQQNYSKFARTLLLLWRGQFPCK